MHKKYIVSVLISALLIQLYGCYSMQDISKDELAGLKDDGDLIVQTKDSTTYFFEESNYHISDDSLYGKGYIKSSDKYGFKERIYYSLPLSNIESTQQDQFNSEGTTWLIVVSVLTTALVVYGILLPKDIK
jgi:hypothetical protein